MMTEQQIAWAASHGWFCESYGDFVSVWEVAHHAATNATTRKLIYFSDFRALLDWAGY